MFERGQLAEDDETILVLPKDISDVRFSAGLDYALGRDRDLIRNLVRALVPCAAP